MNCLGSFIALAFIDELGRRYIMLRTLPGCATFMAGMGIGIWLSHSGLGSF